MKFSTSKEELQSALLKLSKAVPTRSTLPILSNALLTVKEDETIIRATDLEISIKVKLPTSVERIGEIAIPIQTFMGIIGELKNETRLNIECLENKITLTTDKGLYEIMGRPAEEFPEEPNQPNPTPFSIKSLLLNDIINKTIFAVSKDELKPALSGVLFQIKTNSIISVSTDGHRLVKYVRSGFDLNGFIGDVIIPRKFLSLLNNNLQNTETVELFIGENQVVVNIGPDTFYTRIIDERFPDFESVIPKENNKELYVNRLELLSTVKRVSVLSNKTTKQIALNLSDNKIKITTEDAEKSSKGFEKIKGKYNGEDVTIGYNAAYLRDILSHLSDDNIIIKLNTPISAGLFFPETQQENSDLTMLLMPIRLNN